MSEHFSTSSFNVFPTNLNYGNTLFGGKLLAEIDCEAAKVAKSVTYGTEADTVVTASIDRVDFISPARQGDLVVLEADVISFGKSSMIIQVHCFVKNGPKKENWIKICTAKTTFVAIKDEKPYPHGKSFSTPNSKL